MRVISKGQVTIPQNVRESMGILSAETEIEFLLDENGCWYLNKAEAPQKKPAGFGLPTKPPSWQWVPMTLWP
ncbi:hypothetical protein CRENPOLYSF2_2180012 [Crenothrix polyspora]|uniref:SpoVT-AbrB domain-containing protein n=1 Tax=Crenothrix polyspora TaxID=360316 RepID=A0A1R4H500_9GAMM|nr:AbrB/MazE/SpoVT family DNA-binding domain-containing protein [Crenothrix polyspora]SJM91333.1 hypothetical protein CRENPOLYSF2_2180012 [Crenothrix polyspora]